MRIIKKALFVIIPIALMVATVHFYNEWTDGFSVRQLTSQLPYNVLFEVGPLHGSEKERVASILDQPYRYIGKGCQFYAFESKDRKHVIKFLKQKHLRTFSELSTLPMPHFLRKKAEAQITRRKLRVDNLFSSCKLAYEELSDESGLVYIHLNRTPIFKQKIQITDKLGFKHTLNLDDYEFILQKRAISVKEVFAGIEDQELERRVALLVDLVKSRCEKGIRDRDRSFVQNVAFSLDGEHALFIDVGQFYKDPTILLENEQQADVKKRLGNLRYWVEEKSPALLESIEGIISGYVN